MTAELVLATLLETARLGDSGPATQAANARRRVDTPGAGGQIPGDTPWQPGELDGSAWVLTTPAKCEQYVCEEPYGMCRILQALFKASGMIHRLAVVAQGQSSLAQLHLS